MMIIWRALCEYLNEKLLSGKNVNIKGFGAFAFDISTDLPRIATKVVNPLANIEDERRERKHIHKIRPCFVVDTKLQNDLVHYPGKEEITPAQSQYSIYQKGFGMIYCNAFPIAQSVSVQTPVVKDALDAIWAAIIDLIKYGKDIDLNFGFCRINIIDKNLKYRFKAGFEKNVKGNKFEDKMKRSLSPTGSHWRTSYKKEWKKSNLGKLLKKPQGSVVGVME